MKAICASLKLDFFMVIISRLTFFR